MKLHNTLTKRIDELRPIHDKNVGIYSCGPTLYDRVHIGNLNSFIIADMLRRAISAEGKHVLHVMNFTDVDDKTIRASKEKFPNLDPMESLLSLTKEFRDSFMADMTAVGNSLKDISFVSATDCIEDMQNLITDLFKMGYAYVADDGVYFSIEAYKESGKKYGQLLDISAASTSQARIQNDEYDKESVHDFALWKKQKDGEPAWEFTLDEQDLTGRPGWHIECSAMSNKLLGDEFDIHTGGVDLVFPHHENEIAQSTALSQSHIYANAFMHNEHLLVDGRKMSKSLNNFFTLQDLLDKGFDALSFRMLVLQSHYRNQANFSWESLEAAQNRLKDYRSLAVLRFQARDQVFDAGTVSLQDVVSEISTFMSNDLDTPKALAFLSEVSTQLQTVQISKEMLPGFEAMIKGIDDLLGLDLMKLTDIAASQKQMIIEREQARANKDWAKSDQLRDNLLDQGIELRDTGSGTVWSIQ